MFNLAPTLRSLTGGSPITTAILRTKFFIEFPTLLVM